MQYGRALGDGAAQSIRRAAEALWRATTQQSLVVFRLRLFGFAVVDPRSRSMRLGILTFRWVPNPAF